MKRCLPRAVIRPQASPLSAVKLVPSGQKVVPTTTTRLCLLTRLLCRRLKYTRSNREADFYGASVARIWQATQAVAETSGPSSAPRRASWTRPRLGGEEPHG